MPDRYTTEAQIGRAKRINEAIRKLQTTQRSEPESPREKLDRAAAEFEVNQASPSKDEE